MVMLSPVVFLEACLDARHHLLRLLPSADRSQISRNSALVWYAYHRRRWRQQRPAELLSLPGVKVDTQAGDNSPGLNTAASAIAEQRENSRAAR